jgi:hypothetical protein
MLKSQNPHKCRISWPQHFIFVPIHPKSRYKLNFLWDRSGDQTFNLAIETREIAVISEFSGWVINNKDLGKGVLREAGGP